MAPVNNVPEAHALIDIPSTCQRSDASKTIFQGVHSVFSNLHPATFKADDKNYQSVEHYYQSKKAEYFGDTECANKIMNEKNPYRVKNLGSRIHGFEWADGNLCTKM